MCLTPASAAAWATGRISATRTSGSGVGPVDAGERRAQRGGVVVVGLAHVDAALGEVGGRTGVADADCERRVGRAPQDLLDDQAPELTVGSGDQQHDVTVSPGGFGWGWQAGSGLGRAAPLPADPGAGRP